MTSSLSLQLIKGERRGGLAGGERKGRIAVGVLVRVGGSWEDTAGDRGELDVGRNRVWLTDRIGGVVTTGHQVTLLMTHSVCLG